MALDGPKPQWLTFDCYGTLIQWDEGLLAAVEKILAGKSRKVEPATFIKIYDHHEHALEQVKPHLSFREVCERALPLAMQELGLESAPEDADILTASIGRMPPFPEVVETLGRLKAAGFKLCIISNTDDAIIAGNVAQMGGHIDRVVSAQQAEAYKPSPQIFRHAWKTLGIEPQALVHICASPHLDLAAARELKFRCVWVDRGTGRKPLPDYTPDATIPLLSGVITEFKRAGWL